MPQTTVTPDQDVLITEIDIAAPAERVFKALTDPANSSAGLPVRTPGEDLEHGRPARWQIRLLHRKGNDGCQWSQRVQVSRRDRRDRSSTSARLYLVC